MKTFSNIICSNIHFYITNRVCKLTSSLKIFKWTHDGYCQRRGSWIYLTGLWVYGWEKKDDLIWQPQDPWFSLRFSYWMPEFWMFFCVSVVSRHPKWAATERKSCSPLLDHEETTAGPVSAVRGIWTQCQTGMTHTYLNTVSFFFFLRSIFTDKTGKHLCSCSNTARHLHTFYCSLLSRDVITRVSCVFVCFQALEWIHDTGEFYLSTHTSTGSSIHHTQELLKEHEDFQITAKVCVCVCVFMFIWWSFTVQEKVGKIETVCVYIWARCSARCVVFGVRLHSPALCCEAHSQGSVLSCFLTAVSPLLC